MKKCLLLFFFLLVSIALLKFSEATDKSETNKASVDQLVDDNQDERIAKN